MPTCHVKWGMINAARQAERMREKESTVAEPLTVFQEEGNCWARRSGGCSRGSEIGLGLEGSGPRGLSLTVMQGVEEGCLRVFTFSLEQSVKVLSRHS